MLSFLNPSPSLRSRLVFIFSASFILLAIMAMQIINKRFWMHDFEVYFMASKAFTGGSLVYGLPFGLGSGYYKYSPFALYLFIPLSLLPFTVAKVIFYLLISGATIISILFSAKLLNAGSRNPITFSNGTFFILLGIISSQVFRELHLGNINMLLLLLLLTVLQLILLNKHIAAGLLFSVVLFIKPHFLVLLPLLFIRKYYKCLWATMAGLIIGFLLTAMVSGIKGTIGLHKQWFLTMQMHNQSLLQAPDTIYSWSYRIFFYSVIPESSTYLKASPLFVIILVAAAFGWFVLANMRSEKKIIMPEIDNHSFVLEFILLIAIVPNLVLTDSEHFLLSTPVILFLLGIVKPNRNSWHFMILTILAILLYAMNIHDLIGAMFSEWLTKYGILGLGNLMIILLAIFWFRNHSFVINHRAGISS